MTNEFLALQQQSTWKLVPLTTHTILGFRWTYLTKLHTDGTIARDKACIVAQGHHQEYELDYFDTFSSVAKLPLIHMLLTIALNKQWPIQQIDVTNAFLHVSLNETAYMEQPRDFHDNQFPNHVCFLQKFIYSLKQSPR